MPTLKALKLADQLKQTAQTPVCVIVGQDDSLRSEALRLLREAAAPPELPGNTVREFEDVPGAAEVFGELRTAPFMGLQGRRVVIVHQGEQFLSGHWQRLAQYLERPSGTATLLICLEELDAKNVPGMRRTGPGLQESEGDRARQTPEQRKRQEAEKERVAAWRAFVRALRARALVVDCRRPSWADARQWLRQQAEQMGKKLTPRAVDALLEAVGANLLALQNEMAALSAYVPGDTAITERDVEEVVPEARSRSVFDLAGAVGRRDAAGALRLCTRLLSRGETVEGIISVLAFQLRRLWQIRRLSAAGASEAEIIRQMRVQRFVVERALSVIPSLSEERLARQFEVLAAADVELKTTSVRSQEETVWVQNLLSRLCDG